MYRVAGLRESAEQAEEGGGGGQGGLNTASTALARSTARSVGKLLNEGRMVVVTCDRCAMSGAETLSHAGSRAREAERQGVAGDSRRGSLHPRTINRCSATINGCSTTENRCSTTAKSEA